MPASPAISSTGTEPGPCPAAASALACRIEHVVERRGDTVQPAEARDLAVEVVGLDRLTPGEALPARSAGSLRCRHLRMSPRRAASSSAEAKSMPAARSTSSPSRRTIVGSGPNRAAGPHTASTALARLSSSLAHFHRMMSAACSLTIVDATKAAATSLRVVDALGVAADVEDRRHRRGVGDARCPARGAGWGTSRGRRRRCRTSSAARASLATPFCRHTTGVADDPAAARSASTPSVSLLLTAMSTTSRGLDTELAQRRRHGGAHDQSPVGVLTVRPCSAM